jgi:tyrosine-protein kinase Etk/Wzc
MQADTDTPRDFEAWRTLVASVWRRRRLVVRVTAAATLVMLAWVFIMPQTFSSTVTLLPPQKDSNPLALGSLLQSSGASLPMMDIGASLGFGGRPSDLFVEILTSESVADSLVRTEKLAEAWEVPSDKSYRLAIEPLRESTEISANKNGVIRVRVECATGLFAGSGEIDSVKAAAARIANAYVLWLDRINREKMVSRARNSRIFIEQELARTRADLDSALARLVRYQETHQSASIDKQTEAALTSAVSLRNKIALAEAELAMKQMDFAENSRVITQLEAEIDQLTRQYGALSTGRGKGDADYFVPFARIPSVARDMANLMRQVKTLEQVSAFLSQQYYQDKVQEARDTPTVQVLDTAVPALKRDAPRRALWLAMTMLFSLVFSVLYVMVDEVRRTRRR